MKNLVRLYSSFSSEVVSVLLDLLLKALKSSDLVELPVDAQFFSSIDTLLDEWKLVITKFSNKEPELPLALLRAVLDMIETQEAMEHDMGNYQLYLCASFFFSPLSLVHIQVQIYCNLWTLCCCARHVISSTFLHWKFYIHLVIYVVHVCARKQYVGF